MMRRFWTILSLVLVLAFAPATHACPLCAEATEEQSELNEDAPNIAMGYAVSILGMMSLPFLIVGGFGFALYRSHKASIVQSSPVDGDG